MYKVPRIGKLIETKSIIEFTRGWRKKRMQLLFNGYRVSVWDENKVLEMDNDKGCIT